jgi:integrase
MAIYKRGKIYWYKFVWNSELIRESTKQGNDKVARQAETSHRHRLAKEKDERDAAAKRLNCVRVLRCPECEKWFDAEKTVEGASGGEPFCSNPCRVNWTKKRTVVPTLSQFISAQVEPWAHATFQRTCLNNWLWYRAGLRALQAHERLASAPLDCIRDKEAAEYASHRLGTGLQVSTVNSSLRVLRRVLRLAVEWGVLETAPRIGLLPGERHRERVVTPQEEARYLAAATPLMADVATVLADTGLRPDECYRLRWESIGWVNGRNGTLLVTSGKTAAARRVLPLTPRVRGVIEARWESAGRPSEGWVWPAPTRSGHIDHSSLKKQHARTFAIVNKEANENNQRPLKPFILYSLRHTFLTRLGESGCDAWTLARIAGHSSIGISSRYVHPSENAVLTAMSKLGGHNSGHSAETRELSERAEGGEVAEGEETFWRARRDSNSRPIAPEAIALSS